jgi:hypothetical protein
MMMKQSADAPEDLDYGAESLSEQMERARKLK